MCCVLIRERGEVNDSPDPQIGCLLLFCRGLYRRRAGETCIRSLKSGFQNPPQSARPRVWWHWMNGNITKEGIKLDLEWMHRVGLAGFQNFDAALADTAGGRQAPGLHDAGMEGRFQIRHHRRRSVWTWKWRSPVRPAGAKPVARGYPRSEGMKKYVWSETPSSKAASLSVRDSQSSAQQHWRFPEHRHSRCTSAHQAKTKFPSSMQMLWLFAYKKPAGDVISRKAERKNHIKRQFARSRNAVRRRSRKDNDCPDSHSQGRSRGSSTSSPSRRRIRSVTFVTKDSGLDRSLMYHVSAPEKDSRVERRWAYLALHSET